MSNSSDDDKPLAIRREKPTGLKAKATVASSPEAGTNSSFREDTGSKGQAPRNAPENGAHSNGHLMDSSKPVKALNSQKGNVKAESGPDSSAGKPSKQVAKSSDDKSTQAAKTAAQKKEKKAKTELAKGEAGGKQKVKKEFDLPGQTRETPPETDSLRIFYWTLKEQKADSPMATKWLCMHGLLSRAEAEEYLEKVGKLGIRSPTKKAAQARAPRSKASAPKASTAPGAKSQTKPRNSSSQGGTAAKGSGKKPAPQPKAKRKFAAKKDVAFEDGGLDGSDSDDDKPLATRQRVASKGDPDSSDSDDDKPLMLRKTK